jgi:NAD(P)H-hydrate epimerase
VTLLAVESDSPLPEEAQAAREAWLNAGGVIHAATIPWPDDISLIIDGLLGTGCAVRRAIRRGAHPPGEPPSGAGGGAGYPFRPECADRRDAGAVIQADHTLTFIALKPGLLTGKARDVVGQLHHHALGLERWLAGQSTP